MICRFKQFDDQIDWRSVETLWLQLVDLSLLIKAAIFANFPLDKWRCAKDENQQSNSISTAMYADNETFGTPFRASSNPIPNRLNIESGGDSFRARRYDLHTGRVSSERARRMDRIRVLPENYRWDTSIPDRRDKITVGSAAIPEGPAKEGFRIGLSFHRRGVHTREEGHDGTWHHRPPQRWGFTWRGRKTDARDDHTRSRANRRVSFFLRIVYSYSSSEASAARRPRRMWPDTWGGAPRMPGTRHS